jgi:hypothetical protein
MSQELQKSEGVIARMSSAFRALVGRGETKALTSIPQQQGYGVVPVYSSWADWDKALSSQTINYKNEVGDPSGSSLIMAAVRWLGNTLPEAPIAVKENKGAKGESQEIPDHPLVHLLRRPNGFYSGSSLCILMDYLGQCLLLESLERCRYGGSRTLVRAAL